MKKKIVGINLIGIIRQYEKERSNKAIPVVVQYLEELINLGFHVVIETGAGTYNKNYTAIENYLREKFRICKGIHYTSINEI